LSGFGKASIKAEGAPRIGTEDKDVVEERDKQRERNERQAMTQDFRRVTDGFNVLAADSPDRSFQSLLADVSDKVYMMTIDGPAVRGKILEDPDVYEVSNQEIVEAIASLLRGDEE
jgi:hypothetical protein